jgi:hypothetical protein
MRERSRGHAVIIIRSGVMPEQGVAGSQAVTQITINNAVPPGLHSPQKPLHKHGLKRNHASFVDGFFCAGSRMPAPDKLGLNLANERIAMDRVTYRRTDRQI